MSIQPVGSNNSLGSIQCSNRFSNQVTNVDATGGNDGNQPKAIGGGGKFASAIEQALAQLGASSNTSGGTSSTSSSSSTSDTSGIASSQDPQQALGAFMQNLFATLQGQASQQAGSSTTAATQSGDVTNAVSGAGGGHHRHHHGGGGMGKIEGGLQTLIQQLSSSSSADASGSSTAGSGSGSSNSSLDALQQSFDNLLSADGRSGGGATLANFLQTLSQNMQGSLPTGNVIATKV